MNHRIYRTIQISLLSLFLNFSYCSAQNSLNVNLVSSYDTAGEFANGVAVSGNYAYVVRGNGCCAGLLQIIDISNPANLTLVGDYDAGYYSVSGITMSGNYAYLASTYSGFEIWDISNPAAPIFEADYIAPGFYANGVAVSGNYAYVVFDADGYWGLQIFNISNPTSPNTVGTYNDQDIPVGVTVSGNYAYLADGWSGLQIVDISNPANPTLVGSCGTPSDAKGVSVSGNYAYVADDYSGLQIINISNPANPTLVDSCDTCGSAYGVTVSGNYVYLASGGLQIFDISNPANPTLVGYYNAPGYAYGVAVSGNYVYLADYDAGFWILQFTPPPSPSAGFYAYPTIGEGPITVNFWDESANSPTSWSWDFGDGSTSNLQNPTHVYGSVTTFTSYTVQLIASNGMGTSTAIYTNYITVNPPSPPNYASGLPSLKLFTNQSFNNAFFLEQYNTGDVATSYSLYNNFANLATLDGSTVSQETYGFATVGINTFIANNAIGSSTVNNEVKYSTYKINKLPHVGLTAGSSWDVNMANYTYDSEGLAIPPSFGNPDALIVNDTTSISATWLRNTVIHITSLQSFSNAVNVDVIASPNASAPFDSDIDKERIQVYTNLLANSTFSTTDDTTSWSPLEIPPGRTVLATQSWMSSYTDSAGTQANGVWQFTFTDTNGGVKATPAVSNWINISNGKWYTVRMSLVSDTPNNVHQSLLFGYTNTPGIRTQTDIVGNVLFGVPTVWTWQEAPLLAHGNTTSGYSQFQFKAGGAGSIYVDEIQILNAAPALQSPRSSPNAHYLYGQFTSANDPLGWGQETYYGAANQPSISVNNGLVLNFTGATTEGIKWTANNNVQGSGHAYSFPDNVGHQVGTQLTLTIESGNFNTLGIVLVAAYGTATAGDQDIDNLIAAAGVGVLVSGNYYAIGEALYPYIQGQFGIRSDAPGILEVNNVDVNVDNDDPNFGDPALFP